MAGALRVVASNHAVPGKVAAIVLIVARGLAELVVALTFCLATRLRFLASGRASGQRQHNDAEHHDRQTAHY
jgi:hypothetical protein